MKKRSGWVAAVIALVALVATLVVPASPSAAHDVAESTADARDRQSDIATELERLEEQLDEVVAHEAQRLAALHASRARRDALNQQVDALDQRIVDLEGDLRAAQEELDAAQARYLAGKRALDEAEADLRESRHTLRTQAIDAYTGGGSIQALTDALFSVRSLNDLNASTTYMESVLDAQAHVVHHHVEIKEEMAELAVVLDGIQAQALAMRNQVAARRAEMAQARNDVARLRSDAALEADHEAHLLEEVQDQRAEYERRKDDLSRESSSITSFLRSRQSTRPDVSYGDGSLGWPVPGARITSYYGTRRHPIFGTERFHAGIDFADSHGTPVGSAAAGEVLFVGWRGGYGNTVIVDHGGALATLYAHLSAISVGSGEVVGAGTTVGRLGSTGYSTGPHLHFETRVDGEPVDPLQFL